MKKNILKLRNISFPFFGLKKAPDTIEYTLDKIYTYSGPNAHKATLDDKNLSGDYFARLLQMKNRVRFDFTCKNIQDIVYSKVNWGVDSAGIIHDLSVPQAVEWQIKRVKRSSNNLVWLDKISYPFEINTLEDLNLDTKDMNAVVVLINNEWYIKEFTSEKTIDKKRITV